MFIAGRATIHNLLLFASLVFKVEMLRRNVILNQDRKDNIFISGLRLEGDAQAYRGNWKIFKHWRSKIGQN